MEQPGKSFFQNVLQEWKVKGVTVDRTAINQLKETLQILQGVYPGLHIERIEEEIAEWERLNLPEA